MTRPKKSLSVTWARRAGFRRLVALTHGAVEKRLNAFDQLELWVGLTAEPLEADERLEQESEVDRQHDRVRA